MRAYLLKHPSVALPTAALDWREFVLIAQDNRWLTIAARLLDSSGGSLPVDARNVVERYRRLTLDLNGANLMTLRSLLPEIERAQIDVVVIKGPPAQLALHGDGFVKPSTDLDLLVRPGDFARAGEVLATCGFNIPAGCTTAWWRNFLGEQPFLCNGRPVIDLHHRIQQPGCPSPKSLDAFFGDRTYVALGAMRIPILAPGHACLLSCMSLAKAIANREAAGGHAIDVAAYVASCSGEDLALLLKTARACGLLKTLYLGLRTVSLLFGLHANGLDLERAFPFFDDMDLLAAVLEPRKAALARPARTRMLWNLSADAGTFGRELLWKLRAEAARRQAKGQSTFGIQIAG